MTKPTQADELITPDNSWLDEPITQEEIAAAHAAIKESEHDDSDREEAGS